MSRLYNDLKDHVFGRLTVISFSHIGKDKQARWNCTCVCGKQTIVRSNSLKSGVTTSCGCYAREETSKRFTGDGLSSARYVYNRYRLGARKRKYVFELTFEQFYGLTQQDCTYCNKKPSNKSKNSCANIYTYSGIDRRNNATGYTMDNCYPCCKQCNQAKHTMTHNEFLEMCHTISNNWKDRK